MFKTQYLCVYLLLAAGCRFFPIDDSHEQEFSQLAGETILITRSSGSTTPGTPNTQSLWEFRPTGECRYSISNRIVAQDFPPFQSESHWQSKTDYERCLDQLKRTHFFQLQKIYGQIWPGSTCTSIDVACGSRSHQVCFKSSEPPNGISSLTTFLDECAKNSESRTDRKK